MYTAACISIHTQLHIYAHCHMYTYAVTPMHVCKTITHTITQGEWTQGVFLSGCIRRLHNILSELLPMPSLPVHSQAVGLRITPTELGTGCSAVTSSLGYGPAPTLQQPPRNVRSNLWGPVLIWEVDSQQTNHSQDLK